MQANTLRPRTQVTQKRVTREESPPREADNGSAVVAITGVSGYLGRALAALLEDDERVNRIIGIDCKPCPTQSRKLRFHHRSVTDEGLDGLFVREGVTHVAHLAAYLAPNHHRERTREINVQGTSKVLAAAASARCNILYMHRAALPTVHIRTTPFRFPKTIAFVPPARSSTRWTKLKPKGYAKNFAQHPETGLSVIRVVTIVGPAFDNFIARFWTKPFLVAPRGFDPRWQFVHELDAARAFSAVLFSGRYGTYNWGPDDPVRFSEIRDRLSKPAIRLPRSLLKLSTNIAWYLRLKSLTEIPGALIDYLCYPPVLSNDRLKQEIGFEFQFTSREAIFSYFDALQASGQNSETALEPTGANNHLAENL